MTPTEQQRLKILLKGRDDFSSANPAWTSDEAAEVVQLVCVVDQVTAREIVAIERGENAGCVVEVGPKKAETKAAPVKAATKKQAVKKGR